MILTFEPQTYDLTDYEFSSLLPIIIRALALKKGINQAVTNTNIVSGLKSYNLKTSSVRVRKMINAIRNENLVPLLVSTSKGYHIAESKEEVVNYIQSLKQRASAIIKVRQSLITQLNQSEL